MLSDSVLASALEYERMWSSRLHLLLVFLMNTAVRGSILYGRVPRIGEGFLCMRYKGTIGGMYRKLIGRFIRDELSLDGGIN